MRYQVLYPIRHSGTKYEPPAVIELEPAEAAPHLLSGVLLAIPEAPKTPEPVPPEPPTPKNKRKDDKV